MSQIPFLLLYEPADENSAIPTEEDLLNSIDIPDCYDFMNLTCIASEGEIVAWIERWRNS